MAERYREQGLVVLAINAWNESKKRVARYARKEKLKQRFLLDGREVWKTQYDGLLPQLVWIDREGRIVERSSPTSPGVMEEKTKSLVETTH